LEARQGLEVTQVLEINPHQRQPRELTANLAYLLAHDSLAGPYPGQVQAQDGALLVSGRKVPLGFNQEPTEMDWRGLGIRILVDATGDDSSIGQAIACAEGLVEKVIITRSDQAAQATLVRGLNLDTYDPGSHHVISCSTCTANALAPVLRVVDEAFGVEQAAVATVHPGLSCDTLLDGPASEFTAGRSGLAVRPVASQVARTTAQLLPRLKGRLTAMSLRVPMLGVNALLADVLLQRPPKDQDQVIQFLEQAAKEELKEVLALDSGFMGNSRVSLDYAGNPHSAVIDLNWLSLCGPLLRLLIWHDNEYAYCCRVADTLELIVENM
jgi:glyceraldehyde 3-phosphate dehydrogenase